MSATKPSVAVVVPVGPSLHHARWLPAAMTSIAEQTVPADLIVMVDDMHGITAETRSSGRIPDDAIVYRPPWRLGVAHAFNAGCAIAFANGADLALMLGADDHLEHRAIEALHREYEGEEGYYWFDVLYSGGDLDGKTQRIACNCAAITPGLFRETGGFPIESASGGCDAALISIMIIHMPDKLRHVRRMPNSRFVHRVHDQQQTRNQPPVIETVRQWVTATWRPTDWGRYGPDALDDTVSTLLAAD